MGALFSRDEQDTSVHLRDYVFIFLVALGVRLIALRFVQWPVVTDLYWNDQTALNLLHGHGFSASITSPYVPGIFRTPGFPVFLSAVYALFGHSYKAALIAQCTLDAVTAVLTADIAARLFGRKVGVISGWCYTFYVYSAALASMLHQDVVLTFTIALFLWTLIRAQQSAKLQWWVACAGAMAAAIYVKPIVIVCCVAGVTGALAMNVPFRIRIKTTCVFLAVVTLAVAPWIARNYAEFGTFLLASGSPPDAGLETIVDELMTPDGAIAYEVPENDRAISREQYLGHFADGSQLIMKTAAARERNLRILLAHRWSWAKATFAHIPRLWVTRQSRYQLGLKSYLMVLFTALTFCEGCIGMLLAWPQKRRAAALYLMMLLLTIVYAPLHVEARYTLPVRPALMIFCAVFIVYGIERFSQRSASTDGSRAQQAIATRMA